MDLVELLGKKNRKVPVLMTKQMTEAVVVLNNVRDCVGIPSTNIYVFAVVSTYTLNLGFVSASSVSIFVILYDNTTYVTG